MLRLSFRRSLRTRIFRAAILCLVIALLVDILSLNAARHRLPSFPPSDDAPTERVFIASIHWNNEAILRSHWNEAVLQLVQHLGPKNVYVSILESGSWDDSKGALRLLDGKLGSLEVERTILLDKTTHADEIAATPGNTGWIDAGRGKTELRRIPYLSRLRNRSLEPLADLADKGIKFDRILFLNDVVFRTQDVVTLLRTRDGNYAAACSLDFSRPPHYYDTFALRDSDGDEAVISTYPYFRSSASRNALLSGQPVPVQSCWNGIIAFDSAPFYHTPALRFRGIPDSLARYHLEGSECCLVHADNSLSAERGVWLNPDVRVGYNAEAYEQIHRAGLWPSMAESVVGLWRNRLWRWVTPTFPKTGRVRRRVRRWTRKGLGEVSQRESRCLINEMQVLIANGWAHV